MPDLAGRPLLAIFAAGLIGLALGYASEAAAEAGGSGGSVRGGSIGNGGKRGATGFVTGRHVDRGGYAADRARARTSGLTRIGAGRGMRQLDGRGYRDLESPRRFHQAEGSLTYVRSTGRYARAGHDDAFGTEYDGPSTLIFDDAPEPALPGSFPSEPKFIDIATERLDRRPPGPGRVDIIHTGGAKIIRIGEKSSRRQALPSAAQKMGFGYLQPWSSGWLAHCMAAYASFDPELGTYVARDGRVRFCETD